MTAARSRICDFVTDCKTDHLLVAIVIVRSACQITNVGVWIDYDGTNLEVRLADGGAAGERTVKQS